MQAGVARADADRAAVAYRDGDARAEVAAARARARPEMPAPAAAALADCGFPAIDDYSVADLCRSPTEFMQDVPSVYRE